MKIAIVSFHPIGSDVTNIGGIATAPLYMKAGLTKVSPELQVDLISLTKLGGSHKYHPLVRYDNIIYLGNYRENSTSYETLNNYDFIIFNTPGYTYESKKYKEMKGRYNYLLDNLNVPFSFVVNDENDPRIYPQVNEFYTNKNFKGPFFNSLDMHNQFTDWITNGEYLEFNYFPPIEAKETILKLAKNSLKSKYVGATSRWTPRKRLLELIKTSDLYDKNGYKVKIYGGNSSYFYTQKMKLNSKGKEKYLIFAGEYTPRDLDKVFSDMKFHYNFVYLKVFRYGRVMCPRLEIATVEAFNHGVLPIICSDTTPEWTAKGFVRLVGKDQEKIPEVLSTITDEDYLSRMNQIYEELENRYDDSYNTIINYIKNII